jgi:hypothetical protein
MRAMLVFLTVLTAALVIDARPGAAQEYPWCAIYTGRGGGATNCGFVSFPQCLDTVRGVGGVCVQNQRYLAMASSPRPRRKAISRYY